MRYLTVSCLVLGVTLGATSAPGLGKVCSLHKNFSLALHGGAVWGSAAHPKKEAFLRQQLAIGRDHLARGDKALDVVEAMISAMEDSGLFNAGKGSIANRDGEIEMDASIMDGRHLGAGAVASIRKLKNPIAAARQVMDKTPHVMMVGPAADKYLAGIGVAAVEPSYFLNSGQGFAGLQLPATIAPEKANPSLPGQVSKFAGAWSGVLDGKINHVLIVNRLDDKGANVIVALSANEELGIAEPTTVETRAKFLNDFLTVETDHFRLAYRVSATGEMEAHLASTKGGRASGSLKSRPELITKSGTVGAVALDRCGNLAAGTSTGGFGGKLPGRVGDSPIIGAGTYADNRSAAISATGHGEYFISHAAAHEIASRIRHGGESLVQAAYRVVFKELLPSGGEGGVIAIDKTGKVEMIYNTDGMVRGWTSDVWPPRAATYPNE